MQKIRRKGKSFPKPTIVPRAAHTLSRNQISENALKVLYRLHEAGFSAYLVGGAVRDVLLDEHPKDFDVATDAHPEEIRKLFRNCILIGRRFRLAHVRFRNEVIEVATFRTEAKPVANPKNDMIMRDNRYGTIVEDAWRRDFTVNALYYNIADFSVVDFTQGLEDLKHRQLRIIGDPELRYREDPVRMLRAIRFAGKLNFGLHPETEEPIKRLSPLLEWVPAARLFEEFLKLFFHGHGQKTFELLCQYDQFQYLFPSTFKAIQLHAQARRLLELTLKSTDDRVKIDKPVTPAFLLAALLWYPLQETIDIFHEEGQPRQQAFLSLRKSRKTTKQTCGLPSPLFIGRSRYVDASIALRTPRQTSSSRFISVF